MGHWVLVRATGRVSGVFSGVFGNVGHRKDRGIELFDGLRPGRLEGRAQ